MATVVHAPSAILSAQGADASRAPEPPPDRVQTVMRLVMVVALYAVPVIVCLQPGVDWDMWWHLRVGEYVVQTGTVPDHDPFSTLAPTAPWVAYSWLFEVLIYQLHRAFGLAGPMIYST